MKLLIVTASDEAFAPLLKGLVESLHQWGPLKRAELACLDLGMAPATLSWLRRFTKNIVTPGWDLSLDKELAAAKPYLRAQTAHPFLPRHFPGYETYLWLDADCWVQQWEAVDWLVQAAGTGKLAIVPQIDRLYMHLPGRVEWRMKHLRSYFGENTYDRLLTETYYNAGVFALNADAPHWDSWARWFRKGLSACQGLTCCDQTALNYAVWTERLPVYPLPSRCNWLCHLAYPEYLVSDGLFHAPGIPGEPLGILHLSDKMKDFSVPVMLADGRTERASLQFGGARPK